MVALYVNKGFLGLFVLLKKGDKGMGMLLSLSIFITTHLTMSELIFRFVESFRIMKKASPEVRNDFIKKCFILFAAHVCLFNVFAPLAGSYSAHIYGEAVTRQWWMMSMYAGLGIPIVVRIFSLVTLHSRPESKELITVFSNRLSKISSRIPPRMKREFWKRLKAIITRDIGVACYQKDKLVDMRMRLSRLEGVEQKENDEILAAIRQCIEDIESGIQGFAKLLDEIEHALCAYEDQSGMGSIDDRTFDLSSDFSRFESVLAAVEAEVERTKQRISAFLTEQAVSEKS